MGVIGLLSPDENSNNISPYSSSNNLNTFNYSQIQSNESIGISDSSQDYSNHSSYNDTSSSDRSEGTPVSGGSYVGSANTKKFHTAYCSHAERIKNSNKVYFSSRDEAISMGYNPCKVSNP